MSKFLQFKKFDNVAGGVKAYKERILLAIDEAELALELGPCAADIGNFEGTRITESMWRKAVGMRVKDLRAALLRASI